MVVIVVGTFSYECPFQTPLSIIFRSLGVNRLTERLVSYFFPQSGEPDPGAGCVFLGAELHHGYRGDDCCPKISDEYQMAFQSLGEGAINTGFEDLHEVF